MINCSEFKAEVTKMLEKHEVRIQPATTKYKHTRTVFVKALNRDPRSTIIQGTRCARVE